MANFIPILTTSDKLVQPIDPEKAYVTYSPGQIIFTHDNHQIYIDDRSDRIPYLLITKTVINNEAKGIVIGDGTDNSASNETAMVLGGEYNTATGDYSFAAGYQAEADGDYSFAFGQGVSAENNNETVIGKYNATPNSNCLFIIGNGTSQTPSNIVEISQNLVDIKENVNITGQLFAHFNLDWVSERAYTIGDLVINDTHLYRCKTANSDSSFTISKWDQIT